MSGVILSLPQYAFMAWCSVKSQGQLYLYLLPLTLSYEVMSSQSKEGNFDYLHTHSLTPWCRILFETLSLSLSKNILLSYGTRKLIELCLWTLSIVWCLKTKKKQNKTKQNKIKNKNYRQKTKNMNRSINKISTYKSQKDQITNQQQQTWTHTYINT
jgi:hypothetical protein